MAECMNTQPRQNDITKKGLKQSTCCSSYACTHKSQKYLGIMFQLSAMF